MTHFNSILIANRGEIACRVIRSARAQGYRTIAVYSTVDADAPHVGLADDAVCIGAGPVNESYLAVDKILAAAKDSAAQAIHPGYGFLSENAEFAEACEAAGLTFIGPTADAIALMGNKAQAKRRMIAACVPCVPGYEGEDQSDAVLLAKAEELGVPIMVKAAAGGGGRGMRLVHEKPELADAIKLARAEAKSAFGSDELILEKAIIRPRHVEVQVFADTQGNTIHLGERDCSVQRRHQKVVEEAPCPVMTPALRAQMGQAAVDAAKSINYRGAGTVEFLLDESGSFYFLEMNTRLQVEHPVTELITGLDLVALQLQVAQGEPLGISQSDVQLSGHAIEVRLYTEDSAQDFLPTAGPVVLWQPAVGEGIRIDDGIRSGQDISPFYDPMVAKIIGYGATRDIARQRLISALKQTVFFGTKTNKEFLLACLEKDCFIQGQATTAFIAEEFTVADLAEKTPGFADCAIAGVLEFTLDYQASMSNSLLANPALRNWSSTGSLVTRKQYAFGDTQLDLSITPSGANDYTVVTGDKVTQLSVLSCAEGNGGQASVRVDGVTYAVHYLAEGERFFLAIDGRTAQFHDLIKFAGRGEDSAGGGRVVAPMHGLLLEVLVKAGDKVHKSQTLAILEAMKMHYEIVAEADGTVTEVFAEAGKQMSADELLIEIAVAGVN